MFSLLLKFMDDWIYAILLFYDYYYYFDIVNEFMTRYRFFVSWLKILNLIVIYFIKKKKNISIAPFAKKTLFQHKLSIRISGVFIFGQEFVYHIKQFYGQSCDLVRHFHQNCYKFSFFSLSLSPRKKKSMHCDSLLPTEIYFARARAHFSLFYTRIHSR